MWKCGGLSVRPLSSQPALGREVDGGWDGPLCHSHLGTHHEEEVEVMEKTTRMSLNTSLTLPPRLLPPTPSPNEIDRLATVIAPALFSLAGNTVIDK